MKLNTFSQLELENLYHMLIAFRTEKIFNYRYPQNEKEFELKQISVIRMATSNDGMPGLQAIPALQFNWKYWIEILDHCGYIIINPEFRCLGFRDWKIKTNLQTLLDLEDEIKEKLQISSKQQRENLFEIKVRDIINRDPAIIFPILPNSEYKLSSPSELKIKEETINGQQLDIVCRNNGEIKCFIEFTSGYITDDYSDRKIVNIKKIEPTADILVIGRDVHPNIFNKLNKQDVKISTFKQLKDKYKNKFNFL